MNQGEQIVLLRAALQEIAGRRQYMPNRSDYDAGFNSATDMCCDIADEALALTGGMGRP